MYNRVLCYSYLRFKGIAFYLDVIPNFTKIFRIYLVLLTITQKEHQNNKYQTGFCMLQIKKQAFFAVINEMFTSLDIQKKKKNCQTSNGGFSSTKPFITYVANHTSLLLGTIEFCERVVKLSFCLWFKTDSLNCFRKSREEYFSFIRIAIFFEDPIGGGIRIHKICERIFFNFLTPFPLVNVVKFP